MKVLMCAPTHYTISYEINPWMDIENRVRPAKAQAQWDALHQTLQSLKVEVQLIPQKIGCPDMVFTANAGVASGRLFIPSHFQYEERRAEEPAFIHYFKKKRYAIRDAAKDMYFEGEGDLLPYRDMFFGGFRYRSQAQALTRVSNVLGKRLVSLELSRPRFYHLDTCFFPIDDHTALYYPDAFDRYGRDVIRSFVEKPIAVSREDAFRFACNGIRVGRKIIVNQASRALKQKLHALKYDVIETPTSEFMKAGGSVKCLILVL